MNLQNVQTNRHCLFEDVPLEGTVVGDFEYAVSEL